MNATWEEASPLALPADEVPAHPGGVAAPAGLVLATGDPVPRPVADVPQALDVDVHEFARTLALVAAGRLDAFSRRIVGWSVDSTQTTVLVTNALGMATRRRDPAGGLVVHTDRGFQGGAARRTSLHADAPPLSLGERPMKAKTRSASGLSGMGSTGIEPVTSRV